MRGSSRVRRSFVRSRTGHNTYDNFWGSEFTEDTVERALESFIGDGEGGKVKRRHANLVLDRFTGEVDGIEYALQNQKSRIYPTSILYGLLGR